MDNPQSTEPPEAPRIRFEHRLQVRRIWLDRMLIGVLLLVAGLVANIVLESYKADRGQTQYFLDKRLSAATEVRKALTEVTTVLFRVSEASCTLTPIDGADQKKLRAEIGQLVEVLNSSSLLLDDSYLMEASRVVNIFTGISAKPAALTCDAREFISDVAQYLTHQTKLQVAPSTSSTSTRFVPLVVPRRAIDEIGSDAYFESNLKQWRVNAERDQSKKK